MKRDTLKRYYLIHSWFGVLTAVLLFVVAFSGAVAVFGHPELKAWANPQVRGVQSADYDDVERLLKQHIEEVGEAYTDHIRILLPGEQTFSALTLILEQEVELENGRHQHNLKVFEHHPATLELISTFEGTDRQWFDSFESDMADFLITFHADLHLGSPWGLVATGLLGLALFMSVVTGVIIHRKFFKEMFRFRPWRSIRLLLTDTHKALGVWGLLFHGTIGFTGAFLGLVLVLLVPASAFVTFEGDQEKLVATFLPETEVVRSGEYAEMPVAEALRDFESSHGRVALTDVSIYGWGDRSAVLSLQSADSEKLTLTETFEYRLVDGDLVRRFTTFGRLDSVTSAILDAMYPLHFGNFGGILVKVLWFVLGLSTALLAASGMMVWIERRAYGAEGKLAERQYWRISRFTIGACMGLVLASLALFYVQMLGVAGLFSAHAWQGPVFAAAWVSVLVVTLFIHNSLLSLKLWFGAAACLSVGVPVLNGVVTGDWLPLAFSRGHTVSAGVDTGLLLCAGILFWVARRLPATRAEMEARRTSQKRDAEVTLQGTEEWSQ